MLPLLVAALLPLPHVGLHVQESVDEGDSVRVVVTLDRAAARNVRVRLDTRSREAHGRSDYGPVHAVVTIPAGLIRVSVPVDTVADGLDEADESFVVRLRDAENAVLTADRAAVTIDDQDPTPRVLVEDATIAEPGITNQLGFTYVRLSAPSGRRVVVDLAARPGTATTADFVPLHPTAVFAPGETSQLVSVEVLPDDLVEGPETVRLVVTSVRHALPPRRTANITIDDADD
jgi:Calx-beta domain-containing protein